MPSPAELDPASNLAPQPAPGHGGSFTWGFASQGLSSISNLGLSLVAARALGPSGLGVVAISFGSYLAVLRLQRGLITEPLVAISASLPTDARTQATRKALTIALLLAVASMIVVAGAGAAVRGDIGRALLIVAPWLPALVIQDFWRAVLFRDGRARAAAANDGVWLLAMAAAAPISWAIGTTWAVVAGWAVGGLTGALLGLYQTRLRATRPALARAWWRAELWPLGRWLGANSLIDSACSYALIFLLAVIIGTTALGGLNAVTTIFTPLSVVGSAIVLPGLPALARARLRSERIALALALRLGLVSVGLTGLYVGLLSVGGGSIVPRIFGESFGGFSDLVLPVSIGQVIAAAAVGSLLLLKAQRRGRAVLLNDSTVWAVSLAAAAVLGAIHGVTGAAWGLVCGKVISAGMSTILAVRSPAGAAPPAEAARSVVSTGFPS